MRHKVRSPLLWGIFGVIAAGCATLTLDNAYKHALVYGDTPRKGVILFLHGCDGHSRGRLFPWQQEWADYLTAEGFLIVAPDSFADARPPQSCGPPWSWKSEIYELRVQQTRHALQQLRLKYSGTRIFVWGHSEGAGVANLLDDKVDGVMTTGYQCGFRSTGRTDVREDVQFLAIMGTRDHYIADALRYATPGTPEGLCQHVFRSPTWRWVIVERMGHSAPISVPQVREEVNRFFGLGSR